MSFEDRDVFAEIKGLRSLLETVVLERDRSRARAAQMSARIAKLETALREIRALRAEDVLDLAPNIAKEALADA